MNIRLHFFASLREALDSDGEMLELESPEPRVADVLDLLRARGGRWSEALGEDKTVMAAVNQEMRDHDTRLKDGDELAFFPPVTGG